MEAASPSSSDGKYYRVPLTKEDGGSGLGKPLKIINHPVRAEIPISTAALGLKSVALVAEIAKAGSHCSSTRARRAGVGRGVGRGIQPSATRCLGELDVQLQIPSTSVSRSPEADADVRNQLALYVGGMGARDKNFYNQLACRYGYEAEAKEIQDLYLDGRKQEAAAAVPEELVDSITLIGDEDSIRAKLRALWDSGIRTLLLNPLASSPDDRVSQVRRLSELASELKAAL